MHIPFKRLHPRGFKRVEPWNSYRAKVSKFWKINKRKRFTSYRLKKARRKAINKMAL